MRRILKKVKRRAARSLSCARICARDRRADIRTAPIALFDQADFSAFGAAAADARLFADACLSHRFDILGSGLCDASVGAPSAGFCGHRYTAGAAITLPRAYRKRSARAAKLLSKDYRPIDWSRDVKSGFRFDVRVPSFMLPRAPAGADIKMPWELSRMQHLPRLALIAAKLPEYRARLLCEFKDEVVDFYCANPPGFGANFDCSMDAMIRMSNLLLAFDLFLPLDKTGILSADFQELLASMTVDHVRGALSEMRRKKENRNNHFLCESVGVLFCAGHLAPSPTGAAWFLYAAQCFSEELVRQFAPDGANFEGSAAYHALSAETALWGACMLRHGAARAADFEAFDRDLFRKLSGKAAPQSPAALFSLTEEMRARFVGMRRLLCALTRPDGALWQVGDNDSGAFFRLTMCGEAQPAHALQSRYEHAHFAAPHDALCWDEDLLDKRPLVAALGALFSEAAPCAEAALVHALCGGVCFAAPQEESFAPVSAKEAFSGALCADGKDETLPHSRETRFDFAAPIGALSRYVSEDFGILVLLNERFYCGVRMRPQTCISSGGHRHNDLLSVELYADGRDLLRDPGTFVYTALPLSETFKKSALHNQPAPDGMEQNEIVDYFKLADAAATSVAYCDKNRLVLVCRYAGVTIRRECLLEENALTIRDSASRPFEDSLHLPKIQSLGYGKLLRG